MTLKKGSKGTEVKVVQSKLKELGYLSSSVDGIFGSDTKKAVQAFQEASGLAVDGIVGPKTLVALGLTEADLSVSESITEDGVHGTAKEMDWWTSGIQEIFSIGTVATITDVDTGISWKEIRKAGRNHADIQPCTKQDTANFKKACKKWSWARRAVFVTIDGVNYAASINCQPHGGSSVSGNNFPGHHCAHFLNSRTHGSDRVDENHQKMCKKAAEAVL